MTNIAKQIIEFKNEINNFYLFSSMYIGEQSVQENIKFMFDAITETADSLMCLDNLYKILEIICLTISEKQGSSEEMSNTFVLRTTQIGELYKKLNLISHQLYVYDKSHPSKQPKEEQKLRSGNEIEDLYEYLGLDQDVFGSIDPTSMMPTENYVAEPPAGAKVVVFGVKNTQNLIANIRNVVDSDYAKDHFPNMTTKSGVSEEMIRRYDVIKIYPREKDVEPQIITGSDRVFQKLTTGLYRELVHYPKMDYVRNYKYEPINNHVTNFENKKIMLMRQSESTQEALVENTLPGEIKHKFVNEKKRLDDSIFFTIYKPEMSDDEVLRLGLSAHLIQDSLPKNAKLIEAKFDSFINRQTLKKIF